MHRRGSQEYYEDIARAAIKRKFGSPSLSGKFAGDDTKRGYIDHDEMQQTGYYIPQRPGKHKLKPGTVKKSLEFVQKMPVEAHGVKGMQSKPWRKTFKNADAMNKWADKNQAEIHATREVDEYGMVKADNPNWKRLEQRIKVMLESPKQATPAMAGMKKADPPKLDEKTKKALKDWYRNVYKPQKVEKAFKYSCPCGHSETVHTIGGHPDPTVWECGKCGKDTKKIENVKVKPHPPMTDAEWKKYKATEKPLFTPADKPITDYLPPRGAKLEKDRSYRWWLKPGYEKHVARVGWKPPEGTRGKGSKNERVEKADVATAQKMKVHEQQEPIVGAIDKSWKVTKVRTNQLGLDPDHRTGPTHKTIVTRKSDSALSDFQKAYGKAADET